MAPAQPFFRAPLRPDEDFWSGGPGIRCPITRFWLSASLPQAFADGRAEPPPRIGVAALLTLEAPYSVLPFSVRQSLRIACDTTMPTSWQGRPVPRWRGISCQVGTVELFLLNDEQGGQATAFGLQVLLPERDPPGPPSACVFLGEQFLKHYDLRVTLDYSAIRYVSDPVSGRRRLDTSLPCGALEML